MLDSKLTWNENDHLQLSDKLPMICDGSPDYKDRTTSCSIPEHRLELSPGKPMSIASFPLLRRGQIIFVSEMPSYNLLSAGCSSVHPFYGSTANVLERAFHYMNLKNTYFSYTPLIRCWPALNYSVKNDDYRTCMHHLQYFVNMVQPPAIIALGSSVIKQLLPEDVAYKNGKYLGDHPLRMGWTDEPYMSMVGVPLIPTKHPDGIRLVNCNSQINFKSLCVDIMRAIRYAARKSDDYANIAKSMTVSLYDKFYEEMIVAYKNDISKIS